MKFPTPAAIATSTPVPTPAPPRPPAKTSRLQVSGSMLALVAGGVALVTYVGLNLVAPFKPREETLPPLSKTESIFSGDVASAEPPAAAPVVRAAPPPPPPEQATSRPPPMAAPVVVAAAPPPAPPSAPVPRTVPASPVPPPIAPVQVPAARAPAAAPPAPAAAPPAEAARARPAAPAPSVAVAVSAPPPVPVPVAPSARVAVAAPAKPVAPVAAKPAPVNGAVRADALIQWWPHASSPGRLNLLYAGQAANERTLGLLFDTPFAADANVGANVRLIADGGVVVKGTWEFNSTRRMLLFRNLKPGRYNVLVSPQLANQAGQKLGLDLHGPVYIR